MTPKEIVKRTIRFESPPRLAYELPPEYANDFHWVGPDPYPDHRPLRGKDEWGALWQNIGNSNHGEVKKYPLEDWKDFDNLKIPDINDPQRWMVLDNARAAAGDKFLIGFGMSIYERVHFIRGLENTWIDIKRNPDQLIQLVEILTEMNLAAIEHYAGANCDGLFLLDDWGLQDRLIISPESFRKIWKPAYAKIFQAAHQADMHTFLHSCGNIIDIMDDLIEIGLDVIQMDQQQNMGLELLGARFGGRITFFNPVDIQTVMVDGSLEDIRNYCHEMKHHLSRDNGGFVPRWYSDPKGAGHRDEAVQAMCEEFINIGGKPD